jgi:hypothetical protein
VAQSASKINPPTQMPGQYMQITPRPLSSTPFPIHHSLHSTLYSLSYRKGSSIYYKQTNKQTLLLISVFINVTSTVEKGSLNNIRTEGHENGYLLTITNTLFTIMKHEVITYN